MVCLWSNLVYRPLFKLEHSIFRYHWEFIDGLVQGKPNINEYLRIRRITWEMTASPNHSRKFPWYEPFSRSRKLDFPNKYNSDLLSNVFDVFNFSCYFSQCRRSLPPTLTHFPALFFLFLWILFITKYDKIILSEYKHTQKEVFSKRPKLESNTREDGDNKGGFLLTCIAHILWFYSWVEV